MNETIKKEKIENLYNSINKQYKNIKEYISAIIDYAYMYYILCAYLKFLASHEPITESISLEKINNQMENSLSLFRSAIDYVVTTRKLMNCKNESGDFLEKFLDTFKMNEQDIQLYESVKHEYENLCDDFKNIPIMDYKGLITSIMMIVLFDINPDDLEKHCRFMDMFYKKLSSIISITNNL